MSSIMQGGIMGKTQSSKIDFLLTGYIEGMNPIYNSTTAITISSGRCIANNVLYTLDSDIPHTMTSLASAFDFHYIYIDHSASSGSTPTIIDSTTEPTWSDAKRGWYNGDDRGLGVIVSPDTVSTIAYFDTLVLSNKTISYRISYADILTLASNMTPSGSWQVPNVNDGNVVTPVNAVAIFLRLRGDDTLARLATYAASAEYAAINTTRGNAPFYNAGYDRLGLIQKVVLGSSRNIRIAGEPDDEPILSAWCSGFDITR